MGLYNRVTGSTGNLSKLLMGLTGPIGLMEDPR